ncbi:hypothetical protein [Sedimenticola sp.]|uniref:hypothetical protein n=1 Tax=Sedimenticola sp. TaxID=1940285 RepID=UPI003D13DF64
MELILFVLLDALVSGLILWVASKIAHEDLRYTEAVMVAVGASVVAVIPSIGWLLSIIVFFMLLKHFTQADIWPSLILLVLVAKLVSAVVVLALGGPRALLGG